MVGVGERVGVRRESEWRRGSESGVCGRSVERVSRSIIPSM